MASTDATIAGMAYAQRWDDQDEMTTVMVSVRVRVARADDDSPRARRPFLAAVLKHWGRWRGARWAAAWGLPGETVVDWHSAHIDSEDADDRVRLGSEAMGHVPREVRNGGGMFAVDLWNGTYLLTFAPRLHW